MTIRQVKWMRMFPIIYIELILSFYQITSILVWGQTDGLTKIPSQEGLITLKSLIFFIKKYYVLIRINPLYGVFSFSIIIKFLSIQELSTYLIIKWDIYNLFVTPPDWVLLAEEWGHSHIVIQHTSRLETI